MMTTSFGVGHWLDGLGVLRPGRYNREKSSGTEDALTREVRCLAEPLGSVRQVQLNGPPTIAGLFPGLTSF